MKFVLAFMITSISIAGFAIDPRDAYALVEKNEAILIDIREMKELSDGMIEKAAWFPMSEMKAGSVMLKDFRSIIQKKKVFVYCQGGKRAAACQEILKKEGIDAESIGGYNYLRNILPTRSLYQILNEPYSGVEACNNKKNIH